MEGVEECLQKGCGLGKRSSKRGEAKGAGGAERRGGTGDEGKGVVTFASSLQLARFTFFPVERGQAAFDEGETRRERRRVWLNPEVKVSATR